MLWTERRTANTVWYLLLPIFGDKKPERKTVLQYLRTIYKENRKTRADGGIIAGARAELYFRGEWRSVGFDIIEELAAKGTDIVFIEKEGIADVISKYVDKWGIAVVNTRGYLTEYGIDLMDKCAELGANVIIITDYDLTGISIASKTRKDTPWIGINDKTLGYLNLDRQTERNLSVAATNLKIKESVQTAIETDTRFSEVDMAFLGSQRIEIDAVLAKVGNERFFEYIFETLKELYPKRDYNRAIEFPHTDEFKEIYKDNLIGVDHEDFIAFIEARKMDIMKPELEQIKKELKNTEGFIEIEKKDKEIKNRLADKFNKNPDYLDLVKKLNNLRSHPFFTQTWIEDDK